MAQAAAWVGWAILGALALAGLSLSAIALLAGVPFAREVVASRVVRVLDDAIAGSVNLAGIEVLPQGGIELRGLEVFDPDGHLVLAVGRARLSADLGALRARTIGIEADLDAPSVLLEEHADGGVSLARAFAPARRSPGPGRDGGGGGPGWTVHISRLAIRGGEIWWVDARGGTRLEAGALDVDGRGTIGPRRIRAELRLEGELREPLASPLALDLVAARGGDVVRVPVLRLEAGGTVVEAVAEGDIARRRGRLALTRLAIAREQARALIERAPEGSDLRAAGYAESDGMTLTAALGVEPAAEGEEDGGRGEAAVALRLDALRRAAGFDVALDRLDPSRLAAGAPEGALTLTAHGAAAGTSLDDARARLSLSASRSRLRRGEVTRAQVRLRASPGTIELERLAAAAPGIAVTGTGRWRSGGPVSGDATVDGQDLAIATGNLDRLLGGGVPALSGRGRIRAELTGTSAAPAVAGSIDATALRAATVVAEGVRIGFAGKGPLDALEGRADGRIVRLARVSGADVARQVSVRAALQGGDGTLSVTGSVPGAGTAPLALEARGRLGAPRESLHLGELALAWPGSRWVLVRPATIDLRGPAVDRLELAADSQRIAVTGGLGARSALDAHAELSRVDLARLPPGVLSAEDGIGGLVSATVDAGGTAARPALRAKVAVDQGAFRNLTGVTAAGDGTLDGARRRATLSLSVVRGAGGTVDVALDLPVPLRGRTGERVEARVRAAGLPVAELLRAARREDPAAGALSLDLRLAGTVGAPAIAGEVSLAGGVWRDLEDLGATVTIEDVGGALHAVASGSIAGRRVLGAVADVPLDAADLLARPGETLRALPRAHVEGTASVIALDLAAVAGRAGIPSGVAGLVDAHAVVSGPPSAPRGQAALDLTGGAWKGWRRIGAHVELAASDRGLAASGRVTAADQEALRLEAALALRPESLSRRSAFLAAPLRVQATIPRVSLAPVTADAAPVAGTLEGSVSISGTPRAPEMAAELTGAGVSIEGRPLGDLRATARYAGRRAQTDVLLQPSSGGTLRATLAVTADLGAGAAVALRDAPAEASVVADGVGLAFLAAVAPTLIRSAGGQLSLDVTARGPLARLSPRGTVRVAGGRIAVTELGEWTDVEIEARFTDERFDLARLDVRRGSGRLSAQASVTGLRAESARVSAKLRADAFGVSRAGMSVATFDVVADASGTWRKGELALEVTVPSGVVRLPRKSPRPLQTLERRKDIVVGRPEERKRVPAAVPAAAASSPDPLSMRVHVVVPRNLFVKSDSPKVDVELKGDVRYERTGGQDYLEGSVETVRGNVEPIAGRIFTVERGRVQFTGGPPRAALLDIEARYQNPAAVVTVTVAGTPGTPEIRLSSQPPMDEGQIALLIATGRTELKAGSAAVDTLTGEEAGRAALGALATQAFRNLVQDKLPLDTVALDSATLRAGKYVTDKIYVGYVRRFDADPTKNENEDEVRVEYQITPRWVFESRYGNAQSGSASLIWSHDY